MPRSPRRSRQQHPHRAVPVDAAARDEQPDADGERHRETRTTPVISAAVRSAGSISHAASESPTRRAQPVSAGAPC